MEILHITNTIEQGGVEAFLLDLLSEMKLQGHKVTLCVLDNSKCKMRSFYEEMGLMVIVSPYKSLYNPLNILFVCKIIKNYSIIHSHLFPCQYYVAIAKLFSHSNAFFVTTEHCNSNKRRGKVLFRWIEKVIYKQYNEIITISDLAGKNLSQWLHRDCKVIYNGLNLDKFKDSRIFNKKILGLSSENVVVIMIARFYEAKDHYTAIKSMAYLPNEVVLVFIGTGKSIDVCKRLAIDHKLESRVKFLGQQNDIVPYLNGADICLLASHYEGLPISILEYMAAGKPIVASDVPGVTNLVKDIGLLYKDGDAKGLSNQIQHILDCSDKGKVYGALAFEKVQEYSICQTANNYLFIYNRNY